MQQLKTIRPAKGFTATFEAEMDFVLNTAINHPKCRIPGVVVYCRRGQSVYHKAFGELRPGVSMPKDAVFRMYSMTKVLTSSVALILYERGWIHSLDDPVHKYIPSFDRNWDVVTEQDSTLENSAKRQKLDGASDKESVDIRSMITGKTRTAHFKRQAAEHEMLVKHCMAECSGVGYEIFSDLDEAHNGSWKTNGSYAIANAIRQKIHPTVYKSSCILGHDINLEKFCEVLAKAGVLVAHPGSFSYGLGATVLGRVIEIAYQKGSSSSKPLDEIFQELLFSPLGMKDAAFFLRGNEHPVTKRIPALHGIAPDGTAHASAVPAEQSVPCTQPPYSNGTDHFSGPRKYLSGDTGMLCTVVDYTKFLDLLLDNGVSPNGERLLSPGGVDALCNRRLRGLNHDNGVAHKMGLAGEASAYPTSFNFGWATTHPEASIDGYNPRDHPKCNFWSGYAGTHVRFYKDEESYIVIGVQCMDHRGLGLLDEVLRHPVLKTFLQNWR